MDRQFVPSRGTCEELTRLISGKGEVKLTDLIEDTYDDLVSWSVDSNGEQQMPKKDRLEWARLHCEYLSRGENRKFSFNGKVIRTV